MLSAQIDDDDIDNALLFHLAHFYHFCYLHENISAVQFSSACDIW